MENKAFTEDWINVFTDNQLSGQRIMAGFVGTGLNGDLKYIIDDLKAGGIILFARNIESPEQVRALCTDVQAYAERCGQPPLFIAIDQEGGVVARLKEPFTQFSDGNPGMRNRQDAHDFAEITANELADIGVNMDMAPVMDVQPEGFGGVMEKRVFKGGPEFVSEMGGTLISGLQDNGIMAVAKHFPGIGRTTLDSHLTQPVLDMDKETFEKTDLLPFKAAVKKNVSGMMLSHIQYPFIDPEWPASLSVKVVKDLLRKRLNYNGVVMTDDLDMKAITMDITTSVERIIKADVDIALICHKSDDIENAFKVFLKDTLSSETSRADCINSVKRIMRLKADYLSTG